MNFLNFNESNLRLSDDAPRIRGEPPGKARIPETVGSTKIFCYYFFLFPIFFFNLIHPDYLSSDCRVGKQ